VAGLCLKDGSGADGEGRGWSPISVDETQEGGAPEGCASVVGLRGEEIVLRVENWATVGPQTENTRVGEEKNGK